MATNVQNDPTDPATKRPNAPPLQEAGTFFNRMDIPEVGYVITLPECASIDDPISLFEQYYTPEIIDELTRLTNLCEQTPRNPTKPCCRAPNWYPTCHGELVIYLGIRVYMTLHLENELSDYWDSEEITPGHHITKYMTRDRFLELHMRYRTHDSGASGPYEKVELLSNHFQEVNLLFWQPGTSLAVDEIMIRYEWQSRHATTIPNKPTPTGFKVWGVAQRGFLLLWNFHTPGKKGGPRHVKYPVELGGNKSLGKGGNMTQAVALNLVERLPKMAYHVYMDSLFTSTRFLELLRERGDGATGTCRINAGVIQELIDDKKADNNDVFPWGTLKYLPTANGKVMQIGWKDNAFVLVMSTVHDGASFIESWRKKPKETSSKAKTARKPFEKDEWIKILEIPVAFDEYNHGMGAVDEFDNMTSRNTGMRPIRRGGHQAIEYWLLRTVLVNTYLISLLGGEKGDAREVSFRSQVDFRKQLHEGLLARGARLQAEAQICPKRRIGIISMDSESIEEKEHEMERREKRNKCVCCMVCGSGTAQGKELH